MACALATDTKGSGEGSKEPQHTPPLRIWCQYTSHNHSATSRGRCGQGQRRAPLFCTAVAKARRTAWVALPEIIVSGGHPSSTSNFSYSCAKRRLRTCTTLLIRAAVAKAWCTERMAALGNHTIRWPSNQHTKPKPQPRGSKEQVQPAAVQRARASCVSPVHDSWCWGQRSGLRKPRHTLPTSTSHHRTGDKHDAASHFWTARASNSTTPLHRLPASTCASCLLVHEEVRLCSENVCGGGRAWCAAVVVVVPR